MAQNRQPPAFQEYASTTLANISFRSMNMEARGLLHTMRLECWANYELPSDLELLSSVLGKQVTPDMLKAAGSLFDINDALIPLEAIQETDGAPCYQTLSRWIATGLLPKAIVVRRKRYIRKAAWRELLLRQED